MTYIIAMNQHNEVVAQESVESGISRREIWNRVASLRDRVREMGHREELELFLTH